MTDSKTIDAESIARHFCQDYREVFQQVETLIGQTGQLDDGPQLRRFTQTLLNRMLFLRFIECKGWLTFQGRKDYLRALYAAARFKNQAFYRDRIRPLFFDGLTVAGKQESPAYGCVPYLAAALFQRSALDAKVRHLPDAVFAGLLGDSRSPGLFYRYRFTVAESLPRGLEAAIDPEMLGTVFEEWVTGRHATGAYYTPRPVVAFMCREALKGYLTGKIAAPPATWTALVDRHDATKLRKGQAAEILAALDDLKAVDPACGSGAYLLGLLHELIEVYGTVYRDQRPADAASPYDLKLQIIRRNIYGADLDASAADVARLRLWLSLAVEAAAPPALPNLDFQIAVGDSLLARNPERPGRGADISLAHSRCGEIPSPQDAVDWPVRFAEAFAGGRQGFDVVLANPPYVRKENIDKAVKPRLRKLYQEAVTGQSDLFCYFYARGLQLLRPGGMHVFVCSNSWLDSGYGAALQQFLLRSAHIQAIYDSPIERQFATADVNTIVSVLRKGPPADDAVVKFISLRAPFVEAIARADRRREIVISQRELWNQGAAPAGKRPDYVGGKWGGRYLRAPDVYHRVLRLGGPVLGPLGCIADIQGYIHDNNTGPRYPLVRFLKSVKGAETIQIGRDSPGVVGYGVKPEGNSRRVATILFPRTFGARHIVVWNPQGVLGKEFYKVIIADGDLALSVAAQLNSTFGILQREILGLVNLGEGAVKFSAADVAMFAVIADLPAVAVARPFAAMATRPLLDISAELRQPDRRAVDAAIFDRIGLACADREAFYQAVSALVTSRLEKARTHGGQCTHVSCLAL
jgi:methylase of polypeptide subunit release factors